MRSIWHVSLPGIMPVVAILFIFSLGRMLTSGFEKVLLMQFGTNMVVSEVIGTFIYRVGLINLEFELTTAVGLFNTVINFALLIAANTVVKRIAGTGIW